MTVVGCGYTGMRLAGLCSAAGRDVLGLARSATSVGRLRAAGLHAAPLDLDDPPAALPAQWTASRTLVYMVPPPDSGATDPRLGAFLARVAAPPGALVYLSTTAVYGDTGGAAVDEDTPAAPGADRGRRRLDAESAVRSWGASAGVPVRILRVPGIYGPGRLPLERLRQGMPVPRAAEAGPGNRIHVDDLAAVCLAAADYAGPLQIFNVGDGVHLSTTEYFRLVARAAGLPPPAELPLDELLERVPAGMRGFLVESRRVDVRRMHEVLGFSPRYTDVAEGIGSALRQADW